MLDINFADLFDSVYHDLTKQLVISYKFLDRYKKRLKVFAGEMFYYLSFNHNLEEFVNSLNGILLDIYSPQEYLRAIENDRFVEESLEFDLELEDLEIDEQEHILEFLVLNYMFLESYLEGLTTYGQDIFEEIEYNNKLQRYVDEYKGFLIKTLGTEVFNRSMDDHENFTLKDGNYFYHEEAIRKQ